MGQTTSSLGIASKYKALPYYKPVGSFIWKTGGLAIYKIWCTLVQWFYLSARLCGNGLCSICLKAKLRLPGHDAFMLQRITCSNKQRLHLQKSSLQVMTSSKGAVFYIVSPHISRGTTKSTQKVLKQFYTFWGSNTVLFITLKSSVRDVNTGGQFIAPPVKIY